MGFTHGLGIGINWTLDRRESVPYDEDSHAATDKRLETARRHHDFLRWSWEPRELIDTRTLVPKWAAFDYLRWKTSRINSFGLSALVDPFHLPTLEDTELAAVTTKSLDVMSVLTWAAQTALDGLDYRVEVRNEPGIKIQTGVLQPQAKFYDRCAGILASSPDPSRIVLPCYQAGEGSIGMTKFLPGATYAFHLNLGTIPRWQNALGQLSGKDVMFTEVSGEAAVLRWVRAHVEESSLHHSCWGMEGSDPLFTPTFERLLAIGR